jgi:hypothetical protein
MDVEVRRKIVQEIDSFDATVVSLRHLIANLDAVWNSESWEEGARSAFRREWGKLEEVCATAVERQPARLTEIDEQRIREALSELRTLLPG